MIVVVDASVIVKWYVAETHNVEAEILLKGEFDIHVPELAVAEVGNILWKKSRASRPAKSEALRIVDAFLNQNISYHSQAPLLRASLKLANETDQSVYDCTYLALALALSSPLVTADRRNFLALRSTPYRKSLVWIENLAKL